MRPTVGAADVGRGRRDRCQINGEWYWLYAAIDIETKVILAVALFRRYGTDPAAAFLHQLREKHNLSDTELLVDHFGYRTARSIRIERSGQLYRAKPHRELVSVPEMLIDRFKNSWVGSRSRVQEWFEQFVHYYNPSETAPSSRQ